MNGLLLDDEELASLQQRLAADILSAPVPSNLPSPALMPLTQRPPSSLIRFDSLASIQGAMCKNVYSRRCYVALNIIKMSTAFLDLDCT